MIRKFISLMFLCLILTSFGCPPAPIKSKLDELFDKNFEGLDTPEITWIKKGVSRSFPYRTYEQVWDALVLVMIQQGIVVRVSKEEGTMLVVSSLPIAVFVERGETITVYINWITDLYKSVKKPDEVAVSVELEEAQKITDSYFDKIATQLYSNERWKWLRKEGKTDNK